MAKSNQLKKRIEGLESKLGTDSCTLTFPDGSTRTVQLSRRPRHDILTRALRRAAFLVRVHDLIDGRHPTPDDGDNPPAPVDMQEGSHLDPLLDLFAKAVDIKCEDNQPILTMDLVKTLPAMAEDIRERVSAEPTQRQSELLAQIAVLGWRDPELEKVLASQE